MALSYFMIDWHCVSWRRMTHAWKTVPTHPVCKDNLADMKSPCLPQASWWNAVLSNHEGQTSVLQLSVCKLSTMAPLNLVKSSYSFCRGRLLPLQPLGHARRWKRLQDNGRTTAVWQRLDLDFHEQTWSTTLNIVPDLLLHVQARYILQPALRCTQANYVSETKQTLHSRMNSPRQSIKD